MSGSSRLETRLADVPAVLLTPEGDGPAPVVVCWHGFGAPADARSMADRLPLRGLDAWRLYLDLPFFGHRLPELGPRELGRRQVEDYLVELLWPVVRRATGELPGVLAALDERIGELRAGGTALVGFSAGGTAVLHALAERAVTARAAALAGTPPDARSAVAAWERASGVSYEWSPEARAAAARLDAAARADEVAAPDPPPSLLLVHGAVDEVVPPSGSRELATALRAAYERRECGWRVEADLVDGLGHELPPGGRPEGGAPGALDARVALWLGERLRGG